MDGRCRIYNSNRVLLAAATLLGNLYRLNIAKNTAMSIGGARYLLVFVDDYSRMVFVYFIKNKSDIYETFVRFQLLVENQLGKRIKCLRSKNRRR